MHSLIRQRAFSLVELLVSLAIMSFLLLVSAPFLSDWTYSRQIKDAQSKLLSGYGMAKALALRNPEGVTSGAAARITPAAGSQNWMLYVCTASATLTTCGNSNAVWKADFPAGIALTLSTSASSSCATSSSVSSIAIDNRGAPIGGALYYCMQRGGAANDVSGSLI
jgi:prepilin-type N-terminal cleavage/methylation domain-containing protein